MISVLVYGSLDDYTAKIFKAANYKFIVISDVYDTHDTEISTNGQYLMPSVSLKSKYGSELISWDEFNEAYLDELIQRHMPDIALIAHAVSTGQNVLLCTSHKENDLYRHLDIIAHLIQERYNIMTASVELIASYGDVDLEVDFDEIDRNAIFQDLQTNRLVYRRALSQFNSYSTEELLSLIRKNDEVKAIEDYFGKPLTTLDRSEIIEFLEV